MKLRFGLVLTAILACSGARANVIDLGFLSFDNVIPAGPGSAGVNGFTVANLTGDPALGGFALPPSFPSLSFVTFTSATLDLAGPLPQTLSLGDLAPGFYDPFTLGTTFPDTVSFSSATFTATLSQTVLNLPGGSSFTASSPNLTVVLSPSSGGFLTPGVDLAVISVSGTLTTPEPTSALLLLLPGLWAAQRIRASRARR
jgi:hypothetical protein